jgi:Predicted transcriptional regulator
MCKLLDLDVNKQSHSNQRKVHATRRRITHVVFTHTIYPVPVHKIIIIRSSDLEEGGVQQQFFSNSINCYWTFSSSEKYQ